MDSRFNQGQILMESIPLSRPWQPGETEDGKRLSDASTDVVSESSLRQRLATLWSRKTSQQVGPSDEVAQDLRGPFGLRLLHASPEPLIELIFVHGLKGGSIKTWRKGEDHRLFWPKFFLPTDPAFRNASIYSFGYNSDWGSTKHSILNIHDFGNSLLEAMRTSPYLRNNQNPIILIGHSLGGLVIKKAYNLCREQNTDPEFAKRIQAVFFLATPHRGSDYASTLENILKLSGVLSSREYLSELKTGSASAQLINQEFRRYAGDLQIYSFFETMRMNIGGLASVMIVEKASAILGPDFRTERVQYLDANHRDVCKFESIDDPNYLRVRHSLSAAVDMLLRSSRSNMAAVAKAQLAALKTYLGVAGRPDHQFTPSEVSCSWIEDRDDFQQWLAGGNTNPSYYLMTAQPGAGKTVLAAHVVSQVEALNLSCGVHFFQVGNDQRQSVAGLLRSLAFQMASTTTAFRDVLMRLYEGGSDFAMDDARTIWVRIFKEALLQTPALNPQYWIIDALDECQNYAEIFTLLKGAKPSFPLRVMITSRVMPDIPRLLKTLDRQLVPIAIPESSTLCDIQRYIESRADALPVETDAERVALRAKVLAKSEACFLWVRLVLDELEEVYGFESIMEILDGIPKGMLPYYQRAAGMLEMKRKSEKLISKAIFRWVLCATRPLLTTELAEALELESKETKLQQIVKTAVEGLCGHLIKVQANNVVQLVHLTAREFLLSEDANEFQVVKPAAHERIALTCVELLSTPGFRPPRHRVFVHQSRKWMSPLLDYASTNFSHHVSFTSAQSNKLMLALHSFLKTNVLTWIEHVVRLAGLNCLLKTSRDLRGYLGRRVKHVPPTSVPVKVIGDWSIDLTRIVARFGGALTSCPPSIYFVIPPLAPTSSAIYGQFGKPPDGMTLVGQDNTVWDNCLASIRLTNAIPKAVSCSPGFIAVGRLPDEVVLYDHQSFQRQLVVNLGHRIERVHFDQAGKLLITSNRWRLEAWDLNGERQWEHCWDRTSNLIMLNSCEDSVVAFTRAGHYLRWDSLDGTLREDQVYPYRTPEQYMRKEFRTGRIASLAEVSPSLDVLAISYMAQPICLWSCQTNEFIGWAIDPKYGHPDTVIFNPNPEIDRLLVVYQDCNMTLYDPFTGMQIVSTMNDNRRQFRHISTTVSPDGRTIASVDRVGMLTIRDFETLALLFYVTTPDSIPRTLRFLQDSSCIVDITGSAMRVWSPTVLNRKLSSQGTSISDDALELPAMKGQSNAGRAVNLRAICAHPTERLIVAGDGEGHIIAYSSLTGRSIGLLYSHPQMTLNGVTALALCDNLVASSDSNGSILVYEMEGIPRSTTPLGVKPHAKLRVQTTVCARQLIFLPGERLLVSTAQCDKVFSLTDGTCTKELQELRPSSEIREPMRCEARRWVLEHGANQSAKLFLVEGKVLKQFDHYQFPARIGGDIHLDYELDPGVAQDPKMVFAAFLKGSRLILDTRLVQGLAQITSTLLFDMETTSSRAQGISPSDVVSEDKYAEGTVTTLVPPSPLTARLARKVRRMVVPRPDNNIAEDLLFLDDTNWLSSVSITDPNVDSYTRHFPVSNDYVTYDRGDEVLPIRTIDDDVVFSFGGGLAVIKNGMQHEHVKRL